ncbi:hypothetical protein J6590_104803 [Homalodisca vitripennis]|nr:hypothetical protein J6590_104803 [Homalodisca vitripennis]
MSAKNTRDLPSPIDKLGRKSGLYYDVLLLPISGIVSQVYLLAIVPELAGLLPSQISEKRLRKFPGNDRSSSVDTVSTSSFRFRLPAYPVTAATQWRHLTTDWAFRNRHLVA